jgi:hypothetical protein
MLFQARISLTPGVVGVDPIADPGAVPDSALLDLPVADPFMGFEWDNVLFALVAPSGETVTGDVWALDQTPPAAGGKLRVFVLVARVDLTANVLFSLRPPIAGTLYFQQIADALSAAATLQVSLS